MILLDSASLLLCAWVLTGALRVIADPLERLALAGIGFGLLKSLEIFCLLVLGRIPLLLEQTVMSVAALAAALVWALVRSRRPAPPPEPPRVKAPVRLKLAAGAGVLALTAAALGLNAWFPVTAPDGLEYQVRAWDFFHRGDLLAPHTTPVFRQYPPLVPLLFAWLYSAGCSTEKLIFPVVSLLLTLVLYARVRATTRNETLAVWAALVWATTPYVFWHSLLGLLNLTTAAGFALGVFYGHELFRRLSRENPPGPLWPWALLSGIGFGAAAWTRPEMVLYTVLPLFLLMYQLHRVPRLDGDSDGRLLGAFALPALGAPLLWGAVLILKIPGLLPASGLVLALTLAEAALAGLWAAGWFRASGKSLAMWIGGGALVFLILLFAGEGALGPWRALSLGAFRTVVFHVFFAFTFLVLAFVFTTRWSRLDAAGRSLGLFLAGYLVLHFAVYTLLPQKAPDAVQFFDSFFISPGDAVNSPDTREYLAWYPAFLLWVTQLSKVRRAFDEA